MSTIAALDSASTPSHHCMRNLFLCLPVLPNAPWTCTLINRSCQIGSWTQRGTTPPIQRMPSNLSVRGECRWESYAVNLKWPYIVLDTDLCAFLWKLRNSPHFCRLERIPFNVLEECPISYPYQRTPSIPVSCMCPSVKKKRSWGKLALWTL